MPEKDTLGQTFEEWCTFNQKTCEKCNKPPQEHEGELVGGYWFAHCAGEERQKPNIQKLPWRPFSERLTEKRMNNLEPDADDATKVQAIEDYLNINAVQRIAQQGSFVGQSKRVQRRLEKKRAKKK